MNSRRVPNDFGALLIYAALALTFLWPLVPRLSTHILSYDVYGIPDATDSFEWVWRSWWLLASLGHKVPFFDCSWVMPPDGANLVFHSHPLTSEILTLPIGLAFGPVVSTNCMVLLQLIGGAWVYFMFLSRGFRLSFPSSVIGGALFGFSPYFLWRSHVHLNMLGACFWGAALALLLHSLYRERLTLARGAAFALFFWATFWNSFVEVFMLAIVSALVVMVFGIASMRNRALPLKAALVYFAPALGGAVSLLVFAGAPSFETIEMPLIDTSGFGDLFRFPHLSALSFISTPERPGNWGLGVPYATLTLSLFGIAYCRKREPRLLAPLAILLAAAAILTCDPFHLASAIVRAAPLGEGFRLFSRFFPFVLFFLGILAAFGVEWLWRRRTYVYRALVQSGNGARSRIALRIPLPRGWPKWLLLALALVAIVELYPAGRRIRPVRTLPVSTELRDTLSNGQFCLVVPETAYFQVHNTYQVALDMPSVLISFWDKMDQTARAERQRRFPRVYTPATNYPGKPAIADPAILDELHELNVGFVLFARKQDLFTSVLRGDVLLETDREILIRLEDPADRPL